MNDIQQLFAILFGIYFATTVGTSAKFYGFDSSAVSLGDFRALARLSATFVFLNFLPLVYFLLILHWLQSSTAKPVQFVPALGVLFASLGGFALYRFFVAVMALRYKNKDGKERHVFYSHPDDRTGVLKAYLTCRQPPEEGVVPASGVFLGGLIWLVVCLVTFCLLTQGRCCLTSA